jgi:hypothetical protein
VGHFIKVEASIVLARPSVLHVGLIQFELQFVITCHVSPEFFNLNLTL